MINNPYKQTAIQLPTVKHYEHIEIDFANKPKMVISKDISDKIRYLCQQVPNLEWSGILFYKFNKGNIDKIEQIEIEIVDIHLMDIGTAGHTEFLTDTSIVMFKMKNPKLRVCNMGLIHSHNNMSVFFSGEDISELCQNTPLGNHYVSLIVNNRHDMMAKFAFMGTKKEYIIYKPFTEEDRLLRIDTGVSKEVLNSVNFDIQIESSLNIEDSFISRFHEIKKIADERKTVTLPSVLPKTVTDSKKNNTKSINNTPITNTKAINNAKQEWVTDEMTHALTRDWIKLCLGITNETLDNKLRVLINDTNWQIGDIKDSFTDYEYELSRVFGEVLRADQKIAINKEISNIILKTGFINNYKIKVFVDELINVVNSYNYTQEETDSINHNQLWI